jgi:hypothetical protein
LSIHPKRGKTIDLYTKERDGKLHADCQSRSPKPSGIAEPSSSAWGQARPMGAASHRPRARVRRHRRLRKPPGQIPSQHQGRLFSVASRSFRLSPSCLKKTAPFPSYPRTDGMTPSGPILSSSRTDGTVEFTGMHIY